MCGATHPATTAWSIETPIRNPQPSGPGFLVMCGANGIRTRDLLHGMQTRYQLRHSPKFFGRRRSDFSNITRSLGGSEIRWEVQ